MIHGLTKPLFNTPINWGHPLSQGLVSSYLMNEGGGDLVHDSRGMNDGKMIGMAPMSGTSGWVPGPHGPALAFDGSNDYLSFGNPPWSNFGDQPITISCWFKTNSLAVYQILMGKWGNGFRIDIPTNGILQFSLRDITPTQSTVFSVNAIGINQLYHLVAIRSSSLKYLYLYLNGKYNNSNNDDTVNITGTANFEIGIAPSRHAEAEYLNGLISSTSIYNRALSAQEIAYLYAFPWCMYDRATPAWAQKDYGREARLANYYQQMRAA